MDFTFVIIIFVKFEDDRKFRESVKTVWIMYFCIILFYEKFLDISSNADFFFRDIVIHFEVIVNISVNILESKDRK